MSTRRQHRFVRAQTAWMLGSLVVLVLVDALTLELFFVASFLGFLVTVGLTAPVAVTPRWRRRLAWLAVLGFVAFGLVIVRRILAVLPLDAF